MEKIVTRRAEQLCDDVVRRPVTTTTSRLRWWTQPERTDASVDNAAGLNQAADVGVEDEGNEGY